MDPSGTPALTEYFCEDFPSRTTRSRPLMRKEEIRPNKTWKSIRLKLANKTRSLTLSKALDISSATAQVAPDLLRTIPSDTSKKFYQIQVSEDLQLIEI